MFGIEHRGGFFFRPKNIYEVNAMFLDKIDKKMEKEEMKLDRSIVYWKNYLFEKIVRIFEWNGLPFPQREIETRLILNGFCGVVNDGKLGIMAVDGGMSGVTQYHDIFTHFTYAAPTAKGGILEIGKDCTIVNNTALRTPLYPLVYRTACLLAHADISLKCALVNMRYTDLFATDDESTAENVRAVRNRLYDGDYDCIVDNSIVGSLQNIANTTTTNSGIKDCLEVRQEILKSFYNSIGVRYNKEKKERMITNEITDDDQLLLFNIADMLSQRKSACKDMEDVLGINVTVELSQEFNAIGGDGNENK